MEKENNNLLKKIFVALCVLIGLVTLNTIVLICKGNVTSKNTSKEAETETESVEYDVSMFNTIDATQFMNLVDGDKASVVYMGRSGCGYCVAFLPTLQKAQTEIGYTTNYVDVSEIDSTTEDYTKMVSLIDGMAESFNKENGTEYKTLYGYTPTVAIVKDGKIQDIWIGYSEYEDYVDWLSENGIK